jgi:adenylate cyclase
VSFGQRRLEDATRYWEKATALMETDFQAPGMLITCYTALGDADRTLSIARICLARCEAAVAQDRSNGRAMGMGVSALAVLGETERVKEWGERALLIDPDNMVMRYNFACNLAAQLNDADGALAMLGPTVEKATPAFLEHVKIDPDLDSLREDPRFVAMIAAAEARLAG